MITSSKIKRIPYGVADYVRIQRNNMYYIDKTHFIPLLEEAPYYLFFIRPRRFGKTLWVTLLETYYDIKQTEQFETLFGETYIGAHPTDDRSRYLVLSFNFSQVNPDRDKVQTSFEAYVQAVIDYFLSYYAEFFTEAEAESIRVLKTTSDQLQRVFTLTAQKNLQTYLIIDEYDNFANTLLTSAGQEAYHRLTRDTGFFRHFFNLLKGATTGRMGGLMRLFITGVSPVTMDDVTSGFNIGTNISLEAEFNHLLGLSEADIHTLLTYYQQAGKLSLDIDTCLSLMKAWYNHYCFTPEVQTPVFNTDMVLYLVERLTRTGSLPLDLIDQNVRIDYGKLRHLVIIDRQVNGNFSLLKEIMETGETTSQIATSFPINRLLDRQNFVSLLYYLGLLSFAGWREGQPVLRIPNLTIRHLMYEYIREAFQDIKIFRIDLWHFSALVRGMAYRGEWEAVFDFLTDAIQQQASVRDYLGGEKMIQGFLLAYLNVTTFFLTWSERELGGGFVDLYLEPFLARYPDMPFGYLIELKYIPSHAFDEAKMQDTIAEAKKQLRRYIVDARLAEISQKITLKQLVLIYNEWQLVYRAEV